MAGNKMPETLKQIRNDHNNSQRYLADVLETTHQTISGYEAGRTVMPSDQLRDFCLHYGVSSDYVMGLTKEKCLVLDNISEQGQRALLAMYDYIRDAEAASK